MIRMCQTEFAFYIALAFKEIMNRFIYQVFYEYSGPSILSPFKEQKSLEEIADALATFPVDLRHFLNDQEVCVDQEITRQTEASIVVTVITNLSEQETDDGVKQCLNTFDLLGKKIT